MHNEHGLLATLRLFHFLFLVFIHVLEEMKKFLNFYFYIKDIIIIIV